MINDSDFRWHDNHILVGILLENAAIDIVSTKEQIDECLRILEVPHKGLISTQIGQFGIYPITLSVHYDDTVSLSVDGPTFVPDKNISAGGWFSKNEIVHLLNEASKFITDNS